MENMCSEALKADENFTLHPRLAADSVFLFDYPLCQIRAQNDARFYWLVLVPRLPALSEMFDLNEAQQTQLWREMMAVAAKLKKQVQADKMNIAALGNMVPQLHVHVVGRFKDDAAWPAPVWGHGAALPYGDAADDNVLSQIRARFSFLDPAF